MRDLVLSKVDSPNASPLNLILSKRVLPPYTEAKYARFYWRFEDEPESSYQLLGQQNVGFPFQVPVEGYGREIRISMIGVSELGVASTNDPRRGVQTVIYIPHATEGILTLDDEILTLAGEVLTLS